MSNDRRLKRFAAAVLSMVLCLGTMTVPIGASAYDKCDVNRDGEVSIMDTLYINRYLMGAHYVPDYNRLDVDNTRTIDANDASCVLARVTQNDYSVSYYSKKGGTSSPVPSTVSTAGVYPVTGSRSYERYSYTSKKRLSSYLLTPTTKQDSNSQSAMERKIIDGSDTRYPAVGDENRGIVYLTDIGTGFIVGDHQIATAAHCVYNEKDRSFYDMEIQTYSKSGKLTNTKLTPVEAHIPSEYMNTNLKENPYDYALITVKEDLSGYPQFTLAESYNLSSTGFANVPIYITGCPGGVRDDSNSNNTSRLLYSEEGKILRTVSQNRDVLFNNVDTTGGQSGSPVYTVLKTTVGGETSYKFVVLAVHQGGWQPDGANWGARITRHHKLFYENNPYANH